jgi:hypothetical protein
MRLPGLRRVAEARTGVLGHFAGSLAAFGLMEMGLHKLQGGSALEVFSPGSLVRLAGQAALWTFAPTLAGLAQIGSMAAVGYQGLDQLLKAYSLMAQQRYMPAFIDNPEALQQRQRMMGYLGNSLLGSEAAALARRGY